MNRHNISLNGLRVFEASARHLNFTSAADKLHITQAAVSQQVRSLESQLRTKLFTRQARKLELTTHGQELLAATRPALDSINGAIERIMGVSTQQVLTVTTLPSFASRWLIPRLASFQRARHGFELHLHTDGARTELLNGNVDAAIRLGASAVDGHIREFLMPDALCMVCTPDLAETIGDDYENLYHQPLAMDGTRFSANVKTDITGQQTEHFLQALPLQKHKLNVSEFSSSENVVLSALTGQSVAVTRLSLCVDDLEAGRPQTLFNLYRPLTEVMSLVYPEFRADDTRLRIFRKWLLSEAQTFNNRLRSHYPDVQFTLPGE
jgi:LysR family glycine cleavage system transcriptional activator